jgi:hypothetical protein
MTVVSKVARRSESVRHGVAVGNVIVSVNSLDYISHAHTVATIKYGKRPISVRFRTIK